MAVLTFLPDLGGGAQDFFSRAKFAMEMTESVQQPGLTSCSTLSKGNEGRAGQTECDQERTFHSSSVPQTESRDQEELAQRFSFTPAGN